MRRLFRLYVEGNLDDTATIGRDADPTALIVRRARTDQNDLVVVLAGIVSGLGQLISFENSEAMKIWLVPAT